MQHNDSTQLNIGGRIQKRRIAFIAWLLSLILLIFSIGTFWFPFTYSSPDRHVVVLNSAACFSRIPQDVHNQVCGWGWLGASWRVESFEGLFNELTGRSKIHVWGNLFEGTVIYFGWPAMLFFLVVSILFWRPMRYAKLGHCSICGYNLTGSTTSKCSECGTIFKKAASIQ